MSTQYKYQLEFAKELAESWLNGNKEHVRLTIRGLKNKAQASYIAAMVCYLLFEVNQGDANSFCLFIHPNYR